MDDYLKINIVNLLNHIKNINVNVELKLQVNELYNEFECCDFDLYCYNIENEYENQIKAIIEFYYDNIERVINDFIEDTATKFIHKLKKMCMINFDGIMAYLK